MCSDPGKQRIIIHAPGGNRKTYSCHIFVGTVHMDAIYLKKCEHNIHTNALVAINEGMI